MLRCLVLIVIAAGSLAAQIPQYQFRWKCDPKDGKFIVTPGANSKKFYCWDGQIFSEEKGYTPPPGYVLAYWEEVHRKSQQIREDIDRRGKEMKQQFEQSVENTKRLNQERAQQHQQFMDDLHRRMADPKAPMPHAAATTTAMPKTSGVTAAVAATVPFSSEPGPPPASRAKVNDVKTGMDRASVEAILGKPHGAMTLPEDDTLVESLTYTLDDHATARIRLEKGKVVSVRIAE
jgi:hypothetical protein